MPASKKPAGSSQEEDALDKAIRKLRKYYDRFPRRTSELED